MTEIKRTDLVKMREVDPAKARLEVAKGLLGGGRIVIDGFNPADTGYGDRLCIPITEEMKEEDRLGCFMELTREQAVDLHVKLTNALFAEDQEGR